MKVLLISANTERINMVTLPLGLGLVAAAVRPDVVGISVRNIDDQNRQSPRFLLEQAGPVVAACRGGSSAPVVLGGAGYSIFPRAALAFLRGDFGICGDGEAAFPVLLDRLARLEDPRGIPGVYVAGDTADPGRATAEQLDALPLWDDSLSGLADPASPDLWVPVQSRRGCPNDCSYCSTSHIQGRAIRCRSPRLVVETVARLARAGFRRCYFVDNSFNIPEAHALELCRGLRDAHLDLEWRCILYPHQVGEELVRAMAEAGCVEVALGFESGCTRVLREMNKRFAPDDVRRVSELLAAHGIRRFGFLLLGGPGETRESVEESLSFARALHLDGLRLTVGLRIYPGTPLAKRALAEGGIAPGDDLLFPRFYLAPGLEPWIDERVAEAGSARPT